MNLNGSLQNGVGLENQVMMMKQPAIPGGALAAGRPMPRIEIKILLSILQEPDSSNNVSSRRWLPAKARRPGGGRFVAVLAVLATLLATLLATVWRPGHAGAADRASTAPDAARPNVVMLLLDDAGWTDTGGFGGLMRTPNLDRLAEQGMMFTDCHSPAPNCSPARAGILTGRIPARIGIYSYLAPNHVMHLPAEEVTIAGLLREAGSRTGLFGKWHLSNLDDDGQPGPTEHGFEHWLATNNNADPSHLNPVNFRRNGEPVGRIEGYSCQIVVDETLAWLDRIGAGDEGAAPFFACLWFHEPHTPIASPPELVREIRERHPEMSERDAVYHANIENVDLAVGRLLERLDDLGLAENTVVWFTSDNGPLNAFSKGELRGLKSHVWEGGHRVPGIVRWPARIAAGGVCEVPVSGIDFLPTLCEIMGVAVPADRAIDGASQLPLWEGREQEFRRDTPLYWFFYRVNPSLALREGPWALVARTNDAGRPKAHALVREDLPRIQKSEPVEFFLYHLDRDRGQTRDLTAEQPEVLERLKERLRSLHREVVAEGEVWDIPPGYGADRPRRVWDSE